MCNQTTTNENYNMQTTLPLEVKEEKIVVPQRQVTPTFIPYNNRQVQAIYDLE